MRALPWPRTKRAGDARRCRWISRPFSFHGLADRQAAQDRGRRLVHVELAIEVLDVRGDRMRGDAKGRGHLPVGETRGDESQDLLFAGGKTLFDVPEQGSSPCCTPALL